MKFVLKALLGLASLASVEAGCGKKNWSLRNKKAWSVGTNEHYMNVTDPNFGPTERKFVITVPQDYDPEKKTSLFFYMHSQGQSGVENWHYNHQAKLNNVIQVYPQAMGDWDYYYQPYPGWGIPMPNNNTEACTTETNNYCYRSCDKLGLCGQCSWTTCYDDVHFMKVMLQEIKDNLCIDESQIYLSGCSNGGIFSYYLSQQMPEVFSGYVFESAQPLINQMGTPKAVKGASYITLHGRQDQTVPKRGGVDGSGEWIYYSVDDMTTEWAKVQGCDLNSYKRVKTPYDNWVTNPYTKGYNLKCFEYSKGCAASVINCYFYGTHSNYASFDAKLVYWFFQKDLGNKLEMSDYNDRGLESDLMCPSKDLKKSLGLGVQPPTTATEFDPEFIY